MRHDSSWYGGSQRSTDSASRSNHRRSESTSGTMETGERALSSTDEAYDEKEVLLDGFELMLPAEQQGAATMRAQFEEGAGPLGLSLEERDMNRERGTEYEDDCVSPLESDAGKLDRVSIISSDVPTEGREVV